MVPIPSGDLSFDSPIQQQVEIEVPLHNSLPYYLEEARGTIVSEIPLWMNETRGAQILLLQYMTDCSECGDPVDSFKTTNTAAEGGSSTHLY